MKSERRHELKENDLSHMLEVAKTYLNEHGTKILMIALVVVVVIIIAGMTARSRAVALEDLWQQKAELKYDTVENSTASLDRLSRLTSDATDRHFVLTSLVDQGAQALRLAREVDDPPSAEWNKKAGEAFNALLTRFANNPIAFGAAHCGLATVAENEFARDGKAEHKETARRHLKAVLDNTALNGVPYYQLAKDRIARLDEVFTVVRFVSAPPEEEVTESSLDDVPAMITPVPISEDQVPPAILRKVRAKEDGTIEVVNPDEGETEDVEDPS